MYTEVKSKNISKKMLIATIIFLVAFPTILINLVLPLTGIAYVAPTTSLLNWVWCLDNFKLATMLSVLVFAILEVLYGAVENVNLLY